MLLFDTAYMVDDILFLLDDGSGVLYMFLLLLQAQVLCYNDLCYSWLPLLSILGSITCDTCNRYMLVTTNKGKLKGD
jgi:hypothetical protein